MGKFFNTMLKDLHKLPDSKTLEQMRRDFNAEIIRSQTETEIRVLPTNEGNEREPDVPPTREKRKAGRPKSTR